MMAPSLIVGFGKLPLKSPPATPIGEADSALKANGTLVNGEAPRLVNCDPPFGSISTWRNLDWPLAQLTAASVPDTVVAPSLPIAVEKRPNWFVCTVLLSWYTMLPVALDSRTVNRSEMD